jgi:hypothetical protein
MEYEYYVRTKSKKAGILAVLFSATLFLAFPIFQVNGQPQEDPQVVIREEVGGEALWEGISVQIPGIGGVTSVEMFAVLGDPEGSRASIFLTREADGSVLSGHTSDGIVFEADKQLTTGELSPLNFEICVENDESGQCITIEEMTLQATWQGTGELEKDKVKSHTNIEGFKGHFMVMEEHRGAVAEADIDGVNLGTSDSAGLSRARTMTVGDVSEG